jgi:hypothetical protein
MDENQSIHENQRADPAAPMPVPCCGPDTNNNDAGGGSQSDPFPRPAGHEVNWTDSLRPFLGFYVFKG